MNNWSRCRKQYCCYAEIIHSDWLNIVMCLGTANQSALFQSSIVMLLVNCYKNSYKVSSIALVKKSRSKATEPICFIMLNAYLGKRANCYLRR